MPSRRAQPETRRPLSGPRPRHGLARVLSKLGLCSRAEAWRRIEAGLVRVNGVVCRNPEHPTDILRDRIECGAAPVTRAERVYLMLNKPRGLVTTTADERGRPTVFECLKSQDLPRVVPVGRLDQASEGLLLLTNDTDWAARLTDPASHVEKEYHVQVAGRFAPDQCRALEVGVTEPDSPERLRAKRAAILRFGARNTWLTVVLEEGRNRHLRRMLAVLGFEVLRLVRVRIGRLVLGDLAKGQFRQVQPEDVGH